MRRPRRKSRSGGRSLSGRKAPSGPVEPDRRARAPTSLVCPAERTIRTSRPRASATTWRLPVRPPSVRPTTCALAVGWSPCSPCMLAVVRPAFVRLPSILATPSARSIIRSTIRVPGSRQLPSSGDGCETRVARLRLSRATTSGSCARLDAGGATRSAHGRGAARRTACASRWASSARSSRGTGPPRPTPERPLQHRLAAARWSSRLPRRRRSSAFASSS